MGGTGNRIDVIIPTRNRPRLTAEAIAAVQAQTFADWHLYVVDDASDDDTPARLEVLAAGDPRITILRRDTRGGGNPARQTALLASGAPLVATCDSDDLWAPTKLERQLTAWEEAEGQADDVGVVLCWHDALGADGARRGQVLGSRTGRRWHPFTAFNTSTPLISRAVLEEVGGFAHSTLYPLQTTDHVELFLRLTHGHTLVTVPSLLVHCRHHGGRRNSDGERTLAAADEARALLRDVEADMGDRRRTRAWLNAWVAGRYLELGDSRTAMAYMATALRANGPATGTRILSHYGPWALRQLVLQRSGS
ncbi:MAG: glycosyltransferase family A protein [Aquihabitans sp.]